MSCGWFRSQYKGLLNFSHESMQYAVLRGEHSLGEQRPVPYRLSPGNASSTSHGRRDHSPVQSLCM